MKRLAVALPVAATLLLLASAGPAPAQVYAPGYPYNNIMRNPGFNPYFRPGPPLSPYLNMLRGGSPAANYFLGVVPEIERRQNTALFRGAITDLTRRTEELTEEENFDRTLPTTGHPAVFLNYGGYYFPGVGVGYRGTGGGYRTPTQMGTPPRRR